MRQRVYFNTHTHEFSIKNFIPGHRDYNNVVAHSHHFTMRDCTFKVSEAGRQRVLAEGQKHVHAYVQGYSTDVVVTTNEPLVPISYNPKRGPKFYRKDTGEEIETAHYVFGTVHDGKPTLYAGLGKSSEDAL